MGLFHTIFCKHTWVRHSKSDKIQEVHILNILKDGYTPTGITKDFTREILICANCGKIKIIEY